MYRGHNPRVYVCTRQMHTAEDSRCPVVGALFKSKDVDAAMADHVMYLRGTYFESCTCETICPCLLLLDPTQGFCKAILGWDIEKGHVGNVDVSGLKVRWSNACLI